MSSPSSTSPPMTPSSSAALSSGGGSLEVVPYTSPSTAVASSHSWLPYSWRPTSSFSLAYAESLVLNRISDCTLEASFVMLPCGAEIRTLRAMARPDDPEYAGRTPLLLLHGMGAAIGLWCRNIGALCQQRPVYAIDILGFGRSSRVPFPLEAAACEARFVDSVEQWRLAAGLPERLLLLGHSFGGYLAFCYALRYPGAVGHLLLADPWGMLEPPPDYKPPPLLRRIASAIEYWRLDPLDLLRAAGPFGPGLVRRLRGDLRDFFSSSSDDHQQEAHGEETDGVVVDVGFDDGRGGAAALKGLKDSGEDVLDYIYHCNAQVPSGETGFRRLTTMIAFARRPCLQRAHLLPPRLPLTVIYGGRSRLYRLERARGQPSVGEKLRAARPDGSCQRGGVHEMPECGHHIYAQDWRAFNGHVLEALKEHC